MSWPSVPIRALYRRVEESGREDLPLLSVYRDYGVVPRKGRENNFNKASDDLSRYKVVRPGDLVLNKMKTWQGSLGVADDEGIVSPAYFVGRRIGDVDDRFMHHLLRSNPLIAEYGAHSKGIRPAQWDLSWEEFAAIRVCIPSQAAQRAIADFLDAETARIDAFIAKRRRIVDLMSARSLSVINEATWQDQLPRARLASVATFVDYRGATPTKTDSGVPLITATHIGNGRLAMDTEPQFVSEDAYVSWMRRGWPQRHDVLITTEAPLGHIAQIEEERVALAQRLILLKCDPRRLNPDFLALALRAPQFQGLLFSCATGSTALGIKAEKLKDLRIPLPSLNEQHAVVKRVRHLTQRLIQIANAQTKAVGLLLERRQALITAAVTGELDVPGVA